MSSTGHAVRGAIKQNVHRLFRDTAEEKALRAELVSAMSSPAQVRSLKDVL